MWYTYNKYNYLLKTVFSKRKGAFNVHTTLTAIPDQFHDMWRIIKGISFIDVIDILVVGVLLYYLYVFIRDRRAGKLAIGVLLLLAVQIISRALGMYLLGYIMQNIFQIGIITLVILFQPEIRSMLEKFGTTPLKGLKSIGETKDAANMQTVIDEVVSATCDLASTKTGALIVFERDTKLGESIATGTVIDAYPAAFLIKNIFFNKAPMHDGAMIIRGNRVYAAGCVLPLSNNPDIIKDLGTRHRAGIGMSENGDAVVIIVSEETGVISTAIDGNLVRGYNKDTLTALLTSQLVGNEGEKRKFPIFGSHKNNKENN